MVSRTLYLGSACFRPFLPQRDRYPDERDSAIAEFRDMKMQPALERALRRRGLLKA